VGYYLPSANFIGLTHKGRGLRTLGEQNMRTSYLLGVLAVASMLVVACGDDDSGGAAGAGTGGSGGTASGQGGSGQAGTGGSSTSPGVTSCGNFPDQLPKTCIAGQYCEDEIVSKCTSGCLSEANCTDNQLCVKTSGNVGDCQAKPSGKDCAAFLAKCTACGGGAQCTQQMCDALSTECVNCVKDINCTDTKCDALCGFDQ
jgi:hypothetical protein